jgi:hypothetical protein
MVRRAMSGVGSTQQPPPARKIGTTALALHTHAIGIRVLRMLYCDATVGVIKVI